MDSKFNWSKKWISSKYEVFKEGKPIGYLIPKPFSNSATGRIGDYNILFQTRGFLNQRTEIIDVRTGLIIGEISYNTWKTKASIMLSEEVLDWRSLNWINTKWGISKDSKYLVNSWNRMFSGDIQSQCDNPLHILIGLFISEYFNRSFVAIFTVLFIIIIAGN